jgi:hypothetical protein
MVVYRYCPNCKQDKTEIKFRMSVGKLNKNCNECNNLFLKYARNYKNKKKQVDIPKTSKHDIVLEMLKFLNN